MFRVRTPNPEFSGVRLGVEFRNGVAQIETLTPEQIQRFVGWGYVLEAPEAPDAPDTARAVEGHEEPSVEQAPGKTTRPPKPPSKTASKPAKRPKPTAQRKR